MKINYFFIKNQQKHEFFVKNQRKLQGKSTRTTKTNENQRFFIIIKQNQILFIKLNTKNSNMHKKFENLHQQHRYTANTFIR